MYGASLGNERLDLRLGIKPQMCLKHQISKSVKYRFCFFVLLLFYCLILIKNGPEYFIKAMFLH